MNTNWRNVPIPPKMAHLKNDPRGFPIPYVVYVSKDGTPNFIVNDDVKLARCVSSGICAICGHKLGDDRWSVGGCGSAFHPHGAYIDPPVHHECGTYALQVCPFLAIRNYRPGGLDKAALSLGNFIVIDRTVDPKRPPVYVFVRSSGYRVMSETGYLVLNRPYLAYEFWNDGKKLTHEEGKKIVESVGLSVP